MLQSGQLWTIVKVQVFNDDHCVPTVTTAEELLDSGCKNASACRPLSGCPVAIQSTDSWYAMNVM